ncbi:MAG: metalloregulator ArsR/SmtB family transcription factor [Lachnospiraceae bacterium]|nr:metalloregulator ArsR/SmtB family transcription factor [Lachnospiraceae bacterium]
MLREISREVDYLMESFSLLQHLGAGKGYTDLKESIGRRFEEPNQEILRKFEILEQIEERANQMFESDKKTIQYYFPEQKDEAMSHPGRLVLLWDHFEVNDFQDIKTYKAYVNGLSESEYCERFGNCLQNYMTTITRDDSELIKMSEPYAIISYLMKMEMKDEEKWEIQKLFFDREEHFGKVTGLLEKAEAFLRGYQKDLEELTQMFYQYWSRQLEGREMTSYMKEVTNIDVGGSPLGFNLQASVIRPNVIMLNADIDDDGITYKGPDYYRIGVLFGEGFDIGADPPSQKEGCESRVMQILKLLADKSKFEILSYIRDKEAYGSELAKHLNLTTATVSHHMNALLLAGLVEVKREDKRVYYTANKKVLEEIFDYCRKKLT